MPINCTPLSMSVFKRMTHWLLGMPVASASTKKDGSLFLELGELDRVLLSGASSRPLMGEAAILMEWTWRAQNRRRILFGSESSDRQIKKGLADLQKRTVTSISCAGEIPELLITLSGGVTIHSFFAFQGNPHWVLMTHEKGWIWVNDGRLVHALMRENDNAASARTNIAFSRPRPARPADQRGG